MLVQLLVSMSKEMSSRKKSHFKLRLIYTTVQCARLTAQYLFLKLRMNLDILSKRFVTFKVFLVRPNYRAKIRST